MNHKKRLYGLFVLGLTAATAYAAPPLSEPVAQPGIQNVKVVLERTDFQFGFGNADPMPILNYGIVPSSGIETSDGWELNYSISGSAFAPFCTQGAVTNNCTPKNHFLSQNSCQFDPNENTGWWLNGSSQQCYNPMVRDLHPSTGTQHLRIEYQPPTGTMACSGAGMGDTCRTHFLNATDRGPATTNTVGNKDTFSYEIAFSKIIGNKRASNYTGWDATGAGVYRFDAWGLTGVYFNFNGKVQVCKTTACAPDDATNRSFLAYWKYDNAGYGKLTYIIDRCNNKVTLSYQNSDEATAPAVPGFVSTFTSQVNQRVFTPPYGTARATAPDLFDVLQDETRFRINNINDSPNPTITDIDNVLVIHTPCPDACCHGDTGLCDETTPQTLCESTGGHFYPNVQCAMLGKGRCLSGSNLNGLCTTNADCPGTPLGTCYNYYPPACKKDGGACCDAGPRAGGKCNDGVLPADCVGDQLTYTFGATCDSGFQTLCNIGIGDCAGDFGLGVPLYCYNKPGYVPCAVDTDCNVPGFCYAGQCSRGSPGHCEFLPATEGFCQNMGRCSGSATCTPSTGVGCCDPDCPNLCPAGQTCLAEKQPCHTVPGGADCAFCEGCDRWAGNCNNIGSGAECPSPAPGVAAGMCIANPVYVCNGDNQCPTGTICIIPAVNPGGRICTSDAQCTVPAAPPCAEHKGACCNYVKGVCTDDVYEEDCKGVQDAWFKLELCADVELDGRCDADLGACCDHDTFGGCTDTTYNGCRPSTASPKLEWTKNVLCADVTDCDHKPIPTVSEWGIVVLTLLLLVGAKVYFGRRQTAAA